MYFIIRLVLNAAALLVVAYLIPGFEVSGFLTALLVALVLGIVNAIIRPIVVLLTLPINILTLGLFTLVINALLIWLIASFIKGFDIEGFWPAFWGALVLWVASWITNGLVRSLKR